MNIVTHKAGWVVVDPWTILENGFVQVSRDKISAFGQGSTTEQTGNVIDHGSGVLLPGLVNAHTHLELTALKNITVTENNFINWIISVVENRNEIKSEQLLAAATKGLKEIQETGTLAIAEISTLGITRQLFMDSALKGIWFREFLGQSADEFEFKEIVPAKFISIAGHAPHTTSWSFLVELKEKSRKHCLPFSIHLAESKEEVEFLATGKGPWANLLTKRGIDFSKWEFSTKTPVQRAGQMGILDDKTIAVHLLEASKDDIQLIAEKKTHVCLCPRSNAKLHNKLPDIFQMLQQGISPCLGTDSLASNDSLSMFDEMAFTAQSFPDISPEKILAMATINGAAALGIDKFIGSLAPGKMANMIYLSIEGLNKKQLIEKLVCEPIKEKVKKI